MAELPPDAFARRWVHAFEEDGPEGQVYLPEDADLPRTRRPRERLELSPDGTARLWQPGPDDRPRPRPVTWSPAEGTGELRVLGYQPDRLLIARPPG
jgi:hypothetical protein